MPQRDRDRIMTYYKACLRKHMYFHGTERCYLSKNASFASWIETLQTHFPDARFVVCLREPHRAVPSLLGSLDSGARFFELELEKGALPQRLTTMMQDAYRHLLTRPLPQRCELVQMHELNADIEMVVEKIYARLDIELTEQYRKLLARLNSEARQFKTRTRPIDPQPKTQDDYFRVNFPWYYESAAEGRDPLQASEQIENP
jgi:hypothetical protein